MGATRPPAHAGRHRRPRPGTVAPEHSQLAVADAAEAAAHGQARDSALVRAALTTLGARGVTTITTVITLAIAAKSLSADQLGVVAVLTLLTVFLGFGDFGLGTLLLSRLPAAQARGDDDEARSVVTTTLVTLLATGAVIAVVGVATCTLVPWTDLLGAQRLPTTQTRAAVVAFFVSGGLSIPGALGGRVLAATLRTAASQLWLAAGAVLATVATGVCAGLDAQPWAYVAAIAGVPALVGAGQTAWALYRTLPALRPRTLRVPIGQILSYLRAASLFAIMSVSAVVAYAIDSLVVSSLLDARAAAVFAVAARLFSLVGTTIGLAGQQLWSALTDAITRGDIDWVRSRYRGVLLVSTALTTTASALLVGFGRPVIRLWVGGHLVPPLSLLIAFAAYTVVSTATLQASYLLAAVEQVRTLALVGVGMSVVNLVASIVLTKVVGISGPVLGSLVGLGAVMIVPLWVLTRRQLTALAPQPAR